MAKYVFLDKNPLLQRLYRSRRNKLIPLPNNILDASSHFPFLSLLHHNREFSFMRFHQPNLLTISIESLPNPLNILASFLADLVVPFLLAFIRLFSSATHMNSIVKSARSFSHSASILEGSETHLAFSYNFFP